jgi:hypothetical protein
LPALAFFTYRGGRNWIGKFRTCSIGTPFRFAGLKRQRRAPSTAARSSRGKPLLREIETSTGRPSAEIETRRITVPASFAR